MYSFQQITYVKFGSSTFNMLDSLNGKEYVEALFGLNPNLNSVLLKIYDMFYKHVVRVLHPLPYERFSLRFGQAFLWWEAIINKYI